MNLNFLKMLRTYNVGILQSSAHRTLTRRTRSFLSTYDINPNHWAILGMAKDDGKIRLTHIAHTLDIRPASTVELVETLIQQDMLYRKESSTDRRVKELSLTKKGHDFISRIEPKLRNHMKPLLKDVSPRDMMGYINVLTAITKYENKR